MPEADLTQFNIDENANADAIAQIINMAFGEIESIINNLDADNIVDDSLPLNKIKDGAIADTDVTTVGAANKVVKTDTNGDLVIKDGGKLFIQQAL